MVHGCDLCQISQAKRAFTTCHCVGTQHEGTTCIHKTWGGHNMRTQYEGTTETWVHVRAQHSLLCSSVCVQYNTRKWKSAKNGEGLGTPTTWMTSCGRKVDVGGNGSALEYMKSSALTARPQTFTWSRVLRLTGCYWKFDRSEISRRLYFLSLNVTFS